MQFHWKKIDRNSNVLLLATCQVARLPLNLSRGNWQHICVSWNQKGGDWQAYQGGKLRGEGHGLAAGHEIRPGGVLILGQEQVTVLGTERIGCKRVQ